MMFGWHGSWAIMVMVIFWVAIVGLVVWAIAATTGRGSDRSSARTPQDLLEKRFAQGEITRDEFEERRSVLLSR